MAVATEVVVTSPIETHAREAFEECLAGFLQADDAEGPHGSKWLMLVTDLLADLNMSSHVYKRNAKVEDALLIAFATVNFGQTLLRVALQHELGQPQQMQPAPIADPHA